MGVVRKDGKGSKKLSLLQLEPRGRADNTDLYYTSGSPHGDSEGVARQILAPNSRRSRSPFCRQRVRRAGGLRALRSNRQDRGQGRRSEELTSAKRPVREDKPSALAASPDASGIYVTDSGGNRVLRYSLEGENRRCSRAESTSLRSRGRGIDVLHLVSQGDLMVVSKAAELPRSSPAGSRRTPISQPTRKESTRARRQRRARKWPPRAVDHAHCPVPAPQTVDAIAIDGDCMYWAQRVDSGRRSCTRSLGNEVSSA